uniref:Uncharacterized protein n=1 Tax=Cucumis sativus TaxID=3659 RepID=A0A0A0L9V1_CUCSA
MGSAPGSRTLQLGQSARLREETATGADAEEKLHTAARLRRTIGCARLMEINSTNDRLGFEEDLSLFFNCTKFEDHL